MKEFKEKKMMIINKTIYIVGIFEIYLKKKSGHLPVSAGQLMEWWENAAEKWSKETQHISNVEIPTIFRANIIILQKNHFICQY